MLYNYRLYLSNDFHSLDLKTSTAEIEQILNENKKIGIARVAVDLDSESKSISILSTSDDAQTIQSQVTELLLAAKIICIDQMDTEIIHDHEAMEIPEHNPSNHNHSTAKKKHKKSKHNHSHAHAHDHSHDHTDAHSHDHTHGHSHEHTHSHGSTHGHSHSHENHWLKATLGLLWGVGLIALSIASFNIPMTAYYIITGLTTLMTLYLGHNAYKSTWNALREKKWDTTTLYTISTLTIMGVSLASLFFPGLPMMFEAAPLVLGFWHLAEGVEHSLVDAINKKLDIRDCVNPLVLLKGHPDEEISVKTLIPNDLITIKGGDVIPVDGVLTEGTLLYTKTINGSSALTEFKPGDEVLAGMQLADHIPSLTMRVKKTFQNSHLSLIAKNLEKAHEEKAPVEIFADRVLKYFIPSLLGIAVVSGLAVGIFFTPALALQCVISVLVSACPCALSLITPMAVKIGMKKASEQGIQFKNGKALQAAADIDTIVFDLNGTLTQGELKVDNLQILDPQYLSHFAVLESQSPHPVAQSVTSYIRSKNDFSDESLEITCIDKSHHSGIKGIINGDTFMVGNKDMLLANGVRKINEPYDNPENGSIYMVRNNTVIGQISLVDHLRDDAIATVQQLQRAGKTVHICTGDERASAEKYALMLGISKDNIRANRGGIPKPGEVSKVEYIQELQDKGHKVAMIGDAGNDDIAIATANIGIAIQSATVGNSTQREAGIILQQGRLFSIATAFDIAQKTKDNIYQNLFVSLAYNSTITLLAAGLLVAIGFTINPVAGVALVVLESTLVLSNLYRFKHQTIVTPATSNKIEQEYEFTSSKALSGLGNRSQPKADLAIVPESKSVKSSGFFASNENYPTTSEMIQEEAAYQM